MLRATSPRVADAYGVFTLPDTVLLGVDGVARVRFGGARDWRAPRVVEAVRAEVLRAQARPGKP